MGGERAVRALRGALPGELTHGAGYLRDVAVGVIALLYLVGPVLVRADATFAASQNIPVYYY